MIGEAVAFADKIHGGAFREGTEIPYIAHPMEAVVVVSAFMDDEEIIVTALLHDVMEGAGVTREELRGAFDSRVADLVADESEDRGRSWQERKTRTVRHLYAASWGIKILALGNKLSNIRCTARDYLVVSDAIQQRFNEKNKRRHARYYWGTVHALKKLESHLYFKEYVMLYKTVFGEDIISSDRDMVQGKCGWSDVGRNQRF